MSVGEWYDSWRAVLSGKKRLVIGPRSAVFAPIDNLGLVIVDEEHDSSYKQYESPPYFHARDIAVYRASLKNAVTILGSATPSMESYYNAREGKYELLELPDRISETPLPEVKLIDMSRKKDSPESGKRPIFSAKLLNELLDRLTRNEQALIMQNRRGFSTFVQCNDCGHIETCPDCKITLTFHKKTYKIQCHFCGHTNPPPVFCPECGAAGIRYSGAGTQKVEEALAEQAPGYRTIRMDQDTTRSKSAHRQITSNFEQGESDVMVGTQMIAKGFDFGRVNLVGIISADTGLFLPEFRAAEKTFQLMTQAAGRAGRRKERGLVLIQTMHPDHYSLKSAVEHDYKGFYENESELRAELNYPPYGRIILLRFFGQDENDVINAASDVGNMLRKSNYRQFMLGPAPAPIEKIKKMYRWLLFLKSGKSEDHNGRKIREAAGLARDFYDSSKHKTKAAMTIDVDPVNLL
jgi:primosomal protein N' (replication factor Y)